MESIPHIRGKEINACCSSLTLEVIRLAFVEFEKMTGERPSSVEVHPAQKAALENIALCLAQWPKHLISDEELRVYVPKITVAGVPVEVNANMCYSQVSLLDASSQVCVWISNLAIPNGYEQ